MVQNCPVQPAIDAFNQKNEFALNEDQIHVIRKVGLQLLGSSYPSSKLKPLRLHVCGDAGTGKSHVIKAIRFLFKYFNCADQLQVAAYTGVAANNISMIQFELTFKTPKQSAHFLAFNINPRKNQMVCQN